MDPTGAILIERVFVICYGAMGVSLVMHAARWTRIVARSWDDPDFAMRLGAIPLVIGAALVTLHPGWTPDAGSIVTAVGWLALLKGLVCLWRPEWMQGLAKRIRPTAGWFRLRGALVCVLAGIVAWHASGMG